MRVSRRSVRRAVGGVGLVEVNNASPASALPLWPLGIGGTSVIGVRPIGSFHHPGTCGAAYSQPATSPYGRGWKNSTGIVISARLAPPW